jgi:hypothetical protein
VSDHKTSKLVTFLKVGEATLPDVSEPFHRPPDLPRPDTIDNIYSNIPPYIRGDQEGLFKLVTLNCILNRITGVTFGC